MKRRHNECCYTIKHNILAVYDCVDLYRSWKALRRTLCYTVSSVYLAGKHPQLSKASKTSNCNDNGITSNALLFDPTLTINAK